MDIYGNKHINSLKGFRKDYRTATIEDTIKNKIGVCIEQVALIHNLLNKIENCL